MTGGNRNEEEEKDLRHPLKLILTGPGKVEGKGTKVLDDNV